MLLCAHELQVFTLKPLGANLPLDQPPSLSKSIELLPLRAFTVVAEPAVASGETPAWIRLQGATAALMGRLGPFSSVAHL